MVDEVCDLHAATGVRRGSARVTPEGEEAMQRALAPVHRSAAKPAVFDDATFSRAIAS